MSQQYKPRKKIGFTMLVIIGLLLGLAIKHVAIGFIIGIVFGLLSLGFMDTGRHDRR